MLLRRGDVRWMSRGQERDLQVKLMHSVPRLTARQAQFWIGHGRLLSRAVAHAFKELLDERTFIVPVDYGRSIQQICQDGRIEFVLRGKRERVVDPPPEVGVERVEFVILPGKPEMRTQRKILRYMSSLTLRPASTLELATLVATHKDDDFHGLTALGDEWVDEELERHNAASIQSRNGSARIISEPWLESNLASGRGEFKEVLLPEELCYLAVPRIWTGIDPW